MQWADSFTAVAVRSLTERLATSPVMWLLSRRPWPSTPTLDTLISDLVAARAIPLALAPLPPAAVAGLAGDLLGAAPDEALLGLLKKCAGNPSMVVDLLSTLAEHDELIIDTASTRLLPGSLDQRLRGWLTQVAPLTRQLLDVASIFGRTFDVPSVAKVLHRTVAELLPSVQEALEAGLLVEAGAQFGFQHDLIREAIYDALPPGARRTCTATLLTYCSSLADRSPRRRPMRSVVPSLGTPMPSRCWSVPPTRSRPLLLARRGTCGCGPST